MPNDRFVTLLYYLVRDELPLGQVESIVDRMVRDEAFVPDPTLLAWCEIQRDRLPVYVYRGDLGAEALGGVVTEPGGELDRLRAIEAAARTHVGHFTGQDFDRDHDALRLVLGGVVKG